MMWLWGARIFTREEIAEGQGTMAERWESGFYWDLKEAMDKAERPPEQPRRRPQFPEVMS